MVLVLREPEWDIAQVDPATGNITCYPMPVADLRDPHHAHLRQAEANIWFTRAQSITLAGSTRRRQDRCGQDDDSRLTPYGIVVDREGRVWFNHLALHGSPRLTRRRSR